MFTEFLDLKTLNGCQHIYLCKREDRVVAVAVAAAAVAVVEAAEAAAAVEVATAITKASAHQAIIKLNTQINLQ